MVRKSSSTESEKMKSKSAMNQERLRMLKRNQCLKKKTIELSTLCGIDAMIICLGNDGEITDTWPEKNPQIEAVINRYRDYMISTTEKERDQKKVTINKVKKNKKKKGCSSSSSILSENPSFDEIPLEEGGFSEMELREYEMELEKIIQNPSSDDRLEDFSGKELSESEKKNNRGGKEDCIDSSLVPWVSSFSSSSPSPSTQDPSMVLNFDTMMSSQFAEKNPNFASNSEILVEGEEEKEGFLWDYGNFDSEFVIGDGGGLNSSSSSWSLSPSFHPAATSSSWYCSEEFSVEGNFYFDDTALPTVEEVLRLCNTTTSVAADR